MTVANAVKGHGCFCSLSSSGNLEHGQQSVLPLELQPLTHKPTGPVLSLKVKGGGSLRFNHFKIYCTSQTPYFSHQL